MQRRCISSHERLRQKRTKKFKNNEHITTNRPSSFNHQIFKDGSWKNESRWISKWFSELVNLTFWTLKIFTHHALATLHQATRKGHGEFLFATERFLIFWLGVLWWRKKKCFPSIAFLFSLSSKHDAVRSRSCWYIDQGHLGRFTEVDQLTDVGGSTFSPDWTLVINIIKLILHMSKSRTILLLLFILRIWIPLTSDGRGSLIRVVGTFDWVPKKHAAWIIDEEVCELSQWLCVFEFVWALWILTSNVIGSWTSRLARLSIHKRTGMFQH